MIVLGAAGKVFCAGHDLGELQAAGDAAEAVFARCSALMQAIVPAPSR